MFSSITPYMSMKLLSCSLCSINIHARSLSSISHPLALWQLLYTVHSTVAGFTLCILARPLPAIHAYDCILAGLAHSRQSTVAAFTLSPHSGTPTLPPVLAYDRILKAFARSQHSHTPPLPPRSRVRSYFDSIGSLSAFSTPRSRVRSHFESFCSLRIIVCRLSPPFSRTSHFDSF